MYYMRRIFFLLVIAGVVFVIYKFAIENEIFVVTPWVGEEDMLFEPFDQSLNTDDASVLINLKPWFFAGGTLRPMPAPVNATTGKRVAKVWPREDAGDRILNQLMFVPPETTDNRRKIKKILFYFGLDSWGFKPGREDFIKLKCPVHRCTLSGNRAHAFTADAILFYNKVEFPPYIRPPGQIWIHYFLESPYHADVVWLRDVVNWTVTYSKHSDIVDPYGFWVYYDPEVRQKPVLDRNYAANKTKSVAWFVSNCMAKNDRLKYAEELNYFIPVDIYGDCGIRVCPRFPKESENNCFQMLERDYKFYLAFENSNCREYITEKLYVNALGRNILPIVMGAHPEDYAKSAPEHSYIHVDDFASPKELAHYLHKLEKDDDLYNSYFRWKGTGEFINTYFLCRLCAMLHDDFPNKSYVDVNKWWKDTGACTQSSWRDKPS